MRLLLAGVLETFCGFTMETPKRKLAVTPAFLQHPKEPVSLAAINQFHIMVMQLIHPHF